MSLFTKSKHTKPELRLVICCQSISVIQQTHIKDSTGATSLQRLEEFIKLKSGSAPQAFFNNKTKISPSYCDYIVGVHHIPPGNNPKLREWRYFAHPLGASNTSDVTEISCKKVDTVCRVGSYNAPHPWASGYSDHEIPPTRKTEGFIGPLFPTSIVIILSCKEHNVGSEFEVVYHEWGPKKDNEGYNGYTEEDYAIAKQVGYLKWVEDNPGVERDFWGENFEESAREFGERYNALGGIAKESLDDGENAALYPVHETITVAADEDVGKTSADHNEAAGAVEDHTSTDRRAIFEGELDLHFGAVEDQWQGWTKRSGVWYPPRACDKAKLHCSKRNHMRPGWMFFHDSADGTSAYKTCYPCQRNERICANRTWKVPKPPLEISKR